MPVYQNFYGKYCNIHFQFTCTNLGYVRVITFCLCVCTSVCYHILNNISSGILFGLKGTNSQLLLSADQDGHHGCIWQKKKKNLQNQESIAESCLTASRMWA